MTNEQLAELIGQGGNDELLPLLWEKMKKLYRMWADKYYSSHKDRCDLCGVTADDLRQECYLSMLEAVKAYNNRTDEHKDSLFTSYCKFPFKNCANELIGMRTAHSRNEPLNCTHSSLDEPIDDSESEKSATIADMLPDTEAEQPYRDIEQADYCRSVREAVTNALDEKPRELEVIRRRYYGDEPLGNIAADMGVSAERIRQLEKAAIRKLRNSPEVRALAEISCYRRVSLSSFRRTHVSAVEIIAEKREEKRQMVSKMVTRLYP